MKKALCILSLSLLSACSVIPPEAYYNHGDPENLLDVSSEVVNLNLTSHHALSKLASMVIKDPPARAELGCVQGDILCMQAKEILDKHNVPSQITGSGNNVALVYERVVARDCENRYIDNSINPYNLNYPTFGCSIAGNTVQMVSDKRQFVNPNLLDFQDDEKSVQTYEQYLQPPPPPSGNNGANLLSQTSGYATSSQQ